MKIDEKEMKTGQSYINKVEVLLESLPYIKEYFNKTVVVKIGGSMMENDNIIQSALDDLILMKYVGIKVILIHGGGKQISELSREKGIEPEFIDGLRVTKKDSIKIVKAVLMENINTKIVSILNKHGKMAIGVSGSDSNLIKCHKKEYKKDGNNIDLGFVGEIDSINSEFLKNILDSNYIPVIATLGVDNPGNIYNINADTCTADIAISMKAKKMILLTDVDGIMKSAKDGNKLISKLTVSQCKEMIDSGEISSGMIPKVMACVNALKLGAERTHILSGTKKHSILVEIFTERGIGTMITDEEIK